ncbi:hypothetical protein [Methylophilus sp. 3sh_L]|uniref:hypothetical protein n=1 Tax=Methylophilus sp. 3sh_L TaxID=3377114 RepID=UPI00398F0C0E
MNDVINYEETGFLKKTISAVKSAEQINVVIKQKRHIKLLQSQLNIVTTDSLVELVPSANLIFFMLPFVTLHFYALASGYKAAYENNFNNLNFIYMK